MPDIKKPENTMQSRPLGTIFPDKHGNAGFLLLRCARIPVSRKIGPPGPVGYLKEIDTHGFTRFFGNMRKMSLIKRMIDE
jgi:hypothetical protein